MMTNKSTEIFPRYKKAAIKGLIPYINNSRTHSESQIKQVAASIKEFGFTNPVLIDEDGGIIAGHGRVMAAEMLGMTEVPCIVLDGLTAAQKKAYVIADNQLALNSGWDFGLLRNELKFLEDLDFNVNLLGFDDSFLDDLHDASVFEAGSENDQGRLDTIDTKLTTCPECGKEFDLRGCK